jgi:hypothetical protein
VVRIPELHSVLLDEARYAADAEPFQRWYTTHFPHRVGDPRDAYPEWRFNCQVEPDGKSGFSMAGRNSFLCVYAKLKHEGLWHLIKSVRWVGETGELTFFSDLSSAQVQSYLLTREYGDWWLAGKDSPWGVRSRFRGAQLHFRGYNQATEPDNVHIDLHNPGDPPTGDPTSVAEELPDAIRHFVEDLHNRPQTHTWDKLRAALTEQGVALLPLVP